MNRIHILFEKPILQARDLLAAPKVLRLREGSISALVVCHRLCHQDAVDEERRRLARRTFRSKKASFNDLLQGLLSCTCQLQFEQCVCDSMMLLSQDRIEESLAAAISRSEEGEENLSEAGPRTTASLVAVAVPQTHAWCHVAATISKLPQTQRKI